MFWDYTVKELCDHWRENRWNNEAQIRPVICHHNINRKISQWGEQKHFRSSTLFLTLMHLFCNFWVTRSCLLPPQEYLCPLNGCVWKSMLWQPCLWRWKRPSPSWCMTSRGTPPPTMTPVVLWKSTPGFPQASTLSRYELHDIQAAFYA